MLGDEWVVKKEFLLPDKFAFAMTIIAVKKRFIYAFGG